MKPKACILIGFYALKFRGELQCLKFFLVSFLF